jgi:hypothetical protein
MDLSTLTTFKFRNSSEKLSNLIGFGPTAITLEIYHISKLWMLEYPVAGSFLTSKYETVTFCKLAYFLKAKVARGVSSTLEKLLAIRHSNKLRTRLT